MRGAEIRAGTAIRSTAGGYFGHHLDGLRTRLPPFNFPGKLFPVFMFPAFTTAAAHQRRSDHSAFGMIGLGPGLSVPPLLLP